MQPDTIACKTADFFNVITQSNWGPEADKCPSLDECLRNSLLITDSPTLYSRGTFMSEWK